MSLFSADQLVVHALGDYVFQSDWMAQNKTKHFLPAVINALTYSALFLIFRPSMAAFAVILGTHFLIDRYRLARYLVWGKNWLGVVPRYALLAIHDPSFLNVPVRKWIKEGSITPADSTMILWKKMPWEACEKTGYPPESPEWLSVWLMIIADNIMHVTINALALKFL